MGALKPEIVRFVEVGIKALQTPAMKETIKKALREDWRFDLIRGDDMQLAALTELSLVFEDNIVLLPPAGLENEEEDDQPAIANQIGADEEDDEEEDWSAVDDYLS